MRKLVLPICILTQMICFLLYFKVGSKYYFGTEEAYWWGVFYHVSNQLFTALYIALIPFGRKLFTEIHTKTFFWFSFCFNLLLTLIYGNGLLPNGKWLVSHIDFMILFLGYIAICLVAYFIILRINKKLNYAKPSIYTEDSSECKGSM